MASSVSGKSFMKRHAFLGLDASVPKEHIDDIFSTWDATGGGTIDYAELARILRAATMTKTMEKIRKGVTGRGRRQGLAALCTVGREW